MTIGQSSPTDPLAAYAQRTTTLEARVAELERQRANLAAVGTWTDVTLSATFWTQTRQLRWRYEGRRIFLSGSITRAAAGGALAAGGTILDFGIEGMPDPNRTQVFGVAAQIAASTPDGQMLLLVAEFSGGVLKTELPSYAVAVGDVIHFDGVSYIPA